MKLLSLLLDCLVLLFKLSKPNGLKAVVAENLIIRQQLIVTQQTRKRAPTLASYDRFLFGFLTTLIPRHRLNKICVIIKPKTLLNYHQQLIRRKYKQLFTSKRKSKPGPKGPTSDIINAFIAMKKQNPHMGCPKIALQINRAFGTQINKDVVRSILNQHLAMKALPGSLFFLR